MRVTKVSLSDCPCSSIRARALTSFPPPPTPPTQRGRIAIAFTNDFVPATNRLNTHPTSISYHANDSMTSGVCVCVCVCVASVHGIKGGMIAFIINLNLSTTWKLFDLKFSCSRRKSRSLARAIKVTLCEMGRNEWRAGGRTRGRKRGKVTLWGWRGSWSGTDQQAKFDLFEA
jgi:hypothetical protein